MARKEVTPQTHLIAIIKGREILMYDRDGYENFIKIIDSITDWEEVSEEEYQELEHASRVLGSFTIIERPHDYKSFTAKTIADYRKVIKKEMEERAAREEKYRIEQEEKKRKAAEKKMKKLLQSQEEKRKLYEQLKQELEAASRDK